MHLKHYFFSKSPTFLLYSLLLKHPPFSDPSTLPHYFQSIKLYNTTNYFQIILPPTQMNPPFSIIPPSFSITSIHLLSYSGQ